MQTCNTAVPFLSDDRAKHEEVVIINGLEVIRQLKPKKYKKTDYINYAGNFEIIDNNWNWEAGLIAQELKDISDINCFVKGGDSYINGELIQNAYYLLYNDIHTYNIAATKELDAIVQSQETKISNLEAENLILKQENTLIKSKLNEILSEMGKTTI
jgi:hypothetical protein